MKDDDMAWLFILLGGLAEIVWAVAMDYSESFTKLPYVAVVIVFLGISMVMLSKALSLGLPVGTAYAVWVGIGAIGTILVSAVTGLETLTPIRILFVALIVAGILGLQLTSGNPEEKDA